MRTGAWKAWSNNADTLTTAVYTSNKLPFISDPGVSHLLPAPTKLNPPSWLALHVGRCVKLYTF